MKGGDHPVDQVLHVRLLVEAGKPPDEDLACAIQVAETQFDLGFREPIREPHLQPELGECGPGVGGGGNRSRGGGEGDEERVPRGVDLDPVVGCPGDPADTVVLAQQGAVAVRPELVEQLGRPLDVGEHERHRPRRKSHLAHVLARPSKRAVSPAPRAKWHATKRPLLPAAASGGSTVRQTSCTSGQRVW